MKKLLGMVLLSIAILSGCSGGESKGPLFTQKMAIPFEIVKYEEKIAPVYGNLVPHIAYAKTEEQFELLKARFQVDNFEIDMEKNMAVFVVANSDSCGLLVNSVYDRDSLLSVQLIKPKLDSCEVGPIPHTFVIQVPQGEYTKVQLYEDVILKSSMEIKE